MPSYLDPRAADLTVVGGGITGLAIAYMAARHGVKVRVVEAGRQFGGLLNTFEVAGTRLEHYYHHIFSHDAETHWLFRELGIEQRIQFYDASMGILCRGEIHRFDTARDLIAFAPLGLTDKLRWGLTTLYLAKVSDWEKEETQPALEWLYRHAGSPATETIWRPLLDIKFGPYAEQVPLSWMIGRLRQRFGSRGQHGDRLGYPVGSLHVLLTALLDRLRDLGVDLVSSAPLQGLSIRDGRLDAISTPRSEYRGGRFVVTIPGTHMADILDPGAPELARRLRDVEYFGAVCTVLETDRALSDIYWLNIADQGFPFGGVIEHTNLVSADAYQGRHLTYLSRYFALSDALATMDRVAIRDLMIGALQRVYPSFRRSWIKQAHVFRTATAAVVCDLAFSSKIPPCRTGVSGLYLANMSHVYPDERSINNSVRVAAEACRVMGFDTRDVPTRKSLAGRIGFDT